jgi:hypothetical protein
VAYPTDFPALSSRQLSNAKLYAQREDLIASLDIAPGGTIAEVGVALGDFSDFLLNTLRPAHFTAIDTFAMHAYPEHWGHSSAEIFGARTHREFFDDRFRNRGVQINTIEALSHDALKTLPDESHDLIYVDAGHDYASVRTDGELAIAKTKQNGVVVFNDYIMFDHLLGVPYGVVQAVNEIVTRTEWKIVGFALQHHMFCDIALRRP